jgi:hypothetical protein
VNPFRRNPRARSSGTTILRAAQQAAYSARPDADAMQTLEPLIKAHPRAAHSALRHLTNMRYRFDFDRAYRLLAAAVDQDSVRPTPPALRELFAREEQLGRMPLVEAFTLLANYEPRLREIADHSDTPTAPTQPTNESELALSSPHILLASRSDGDPLYTSELARSICHQYISIIRDAHAGDLSRSYFALPNKLVILATRLHTS